MQRRFSFENYLGMASFAVLCVCFMGAVVLLLGPQIPACFCPENMPSCCTPALFLPPWPQVYLMVSLAALAISFVVALVGVILDHRRRTAIDVNMVYALMLCPFLTLVFLVVVASTVSMLALTVWAVR